MTQGERLEASEVQEPSPPATPRDLRGFIKHPATRVGILFLVLVGLVYVVTYTAIHVISSSFATRSARHLEREVARFRKQIATDESQLDTEAGHVAHELANTPNITRARLFQIVSLHCIGNKRGIRVLAPNGSVVAWAGETLPVPGNASYEFDATNLYLVRSNPTPQGIVQSYERISNQPRSRSLLDPDDDWISSTIFHAGSLRQEPGSRRFILETRPDATLRIDLMPSSRAEILDSTRSDGGDVVALLLAVGALTILTLLWREGRPASLVPTLLLIAGARAALLPFTVDEDPAHLFRFDVYASRILGPFSKSPFDLLLSAAAVLAVVILVTARIARRNRESLLIQTLRTAIAMVAAYGYLMLVRNLVDNSRISTIPEHIIPVSAAQGVLLAALLLFGFALLQMARHAARPLPTLLALVIVAIPATIITLSRGTFTGPSFASIASAVAVALLISAFTNRRILRLAVNALLMVLVVSIPLQRFEMKSARHFIADTYAPLVAGESGQLRSMIEDTLQSEFGHIDLGSVLPDDYTRMSLDDLAYALWLRSDLSKWRIPAVITIRDIFDHPVSRFGVGLPQFSERSAQNDREILQLGRWTRVLIHHDFDLTSGAIPIGEGSVHVVNPADPGATAFADIYRDFFEPSFEDTTTGVHTIQEPIVWDRNGNVHGTPTFRLPQSVAWYFTALKPGRGSWVDADDTSIYLQRTDKALYAFPLVVPTDAQQIRRAGSVALWAIAFVMVALGVRSLPLTRSFLRTSPGNLDFRTRTSLAVAAIVIVPLIIFVLFVRAYLATRLETEYVDQGQTALNAAERVVEDYLASSTTTARPEQTLNDDVLSWLARVIGHDLHLYRDAQLVASSRRDLFAAHIESERLPGDVYAAIVLGGRQMFRAERTSGTSRYVEIYSPINLGTGQSYTLALPFIVQGRQIEAQVGDLATTIYMLLVFIVLGSIGVAFRIASGVTAPVQALVGGARAVARGQFDVDMTVPKDPDLGLLVTTFRDMAQSIRRQQSDLRHERDRLQTLLENINAAVIVLRALPTSGGAPAPQVVSMNLAARRLFPDDELPPAIREFVLSHHTQQIESVELPFHVDDTPRSFRVSIVPLPESDEVMLIAEDVTEILRSNSLEAWGEMARQVAHEIKNPLTPIQLTAEHLLAMADRNDPRLPDVVRSSVDNILRQVVTLRETSREFSDYASLRQIQKTPLNLKHLLEEIAASYAGSSERGIDFAADIAPTTPDRFAGDPRLLRGAVANLIENAFQAAPGGRVRLAASGVDSRVVVSVEDSGPGVPNEILPRIFDPYFSTKSSGTGLGLAIARKAIEEHGGSVHAENLNPGFRIWIEMPVKQ
jgi:signal transduction histidine kinase